MTDDIRSRDTYPVVVEVRCPERSSRLQALLALTVFPKLLLLIPHYFVLWVLGVLALIAAIVGLMTVLLIGKYPQSRFNFQVGVLRWNTRISAWFMCLVDRYPPFRIYS